ncbi:MAG: ZIP family metal transporter [Nitrosopumilaceae archaeon]|jgi:zinc and cadmium transporter
MVFSLIILFSILGSIGAIGIAAIFLLFPQKIRKVLIPCLVSYAVGTLLAGAFLGLIPNSISRLDTTYSLLTVLFGLVGFFILEKTMLYRHCHEQHCDKHRVAGPLIVVGDAFHNSVDGIIIAVSFFVSIPFGIAASLAIIAHEIPQEVADFAVLLESGYPRKKAFLLNSISASTAIIGAIPTFFFLTLFETAVPYVMALSASSFIYIGLADLVPHLHVKTSPKNGVRQVILILAGIGTLALIFFT